MRTPTPGCLEPETRKPRRANVEAFNNVVPFRQRKKNMNHATAAVLPLQESGDRVQSRPTAKARDALQHVACVLRGLRSVGQGGVASGDGLDADQCFLLCATLDDVIAKIDSVDLPRAA